MIGSAVKVERVCKVFGNFKALNDVSFEIKKGEFFSLLGPSGCGKTTLLRIIAGFEDPSSGSVFLDDCNVIPVPANKRHVNTVFQNYALFPHLTVFENVAFPLRIKKTKESSIRQQVNEYLELVKLPGEGSKFPAQLSGGQQQRVAIARALKTSRVYCCWMNLYLLLMPSCASTCLLSSTLSTIKLELPLSM